jgi:hypothetical protein
MTIAHRLDQQKRTAIENLGLPGLEMHFDAFKLENVAQFERLLLDETQYKQWLFNPKKQQIETHLQVALKEQIQIQEVEYAQKIERQRERQQAQELAQTKLKQERELHEKKQWQERLDSEAQQDQARRHLLRQQ